MTKKTKMGQICAQNARLGNARKIVNATFKGKDSRIDLGIDGKLLPGIM